MFLKSVTLTTLTLFASFTPIANGRDEGFNGRWVLDKASPKPPDAPNNLVTKINQDGSGITLESTFKEPENGVVPILYLGLMTTKLRLSTDGQEQQNTIGPFQMTSKTVVNGNELQTDWSANMKGDQVQGHWTHRLSDDGKHLTWEIQESSAQEKRAETTLHFVRK